MKILILLISFLLTACTANSASKEPNWMPVGVPAMEREEVGRLLGIAGELSRYSKPWWFKQPTVLLMPSDQFVPLICGPWAELFGCPVLGAYPHDYPNVILIRTDPRISEQKQQEVLVHEMVHWLQYRAGWINKSNTCRDKSLQEIEAYQVSNLYAYKFLGVNRNFRLPPILDCSEDK